MKGIIGKKVGMTSIYDENGRNIACTVLEVSPCVVTQVKTADTDGYDALQLGYGEARTKNTSKQLQGHFKKANTTPKRVLKEFRDVPLDKELGEEVRVDELFEEGELLNIVGNTKGKGFQGVVKRHGFGGVGDATHGQHNRMRAPGSIGAASDPSKVIKGIRMAGQTGNNRVKIKNLRVVKIFGEKNLLVVKGAVPGHKGSIVTLEK